MQIVHSCKIHFVMTHSIFDDSAFEFQSAFVEAILNGNKTAHSRKLYKKISSSCKRNFCQLIVNSSGFL